MFVNFWKTSGKGSKLFLKSFNYFKKIQKILENLRKCSEVIGKFADRAQLFENVRRSLKVSELVLILRSPENDASITVTRNNDGKEELNTTRYILPVACIPPTSRVPGSFLL